MRLSDSKEKDLGSHQFERLVLANHLLGPLLLVENPLNHQFGKLVMANHLFGRLVLGNHLVNQRFRRLVLVEHPANHQFERPVLEFLSIQYFRLAVV